MGIRDAGSIDIVMERPPFETEECKLVLIVIDATSDLSEQERFAMLVRKLAGYFTYVAGADFAKDYPKLKPADVIVRVLTAMPPTIEMQMINAFKTSEEGVRVRVFFDDYQAYMAKVRAGRPAKPGVN